LLAHAQVMLGFDKGHRASRIRIRVS
jgi:hypothetical protein